MINAIKIDIWGRCFELPVEHAPFDDERTPEVMNASLKDFVSRKEWMDKAKKEVEAYCRHDVLRDENNQKKDNIFSYVIPEYVFIKISPDGPIIVLVCRYRYDEEHGIMVVFHSSGKVKVGGQDMPF